MKKQHGHPAKGFVRNKGKRNSPSLVPVKPASGPLDLGPNVAVSFSIRRFVEMLFVHTLGVGAYYRGPGPLTVKWGLDTPEGEVSHSDDFLVCDAAAQRRFAIGYLAKELLSKYDDGKENPAKRQTAVERFDLAEEMCRASNERFDHAPGTVPTWGNPRRRSGWLDPVTGEVVPLEVLQVARLARELLHKLFRLEDDLVGRLYSRSGHGPGATTRLKRKDAHQGGKWGGLPHVTANASTFADRLLTELPGYQAAGGGYFIFPGNLVDWVPKNYKTDRTIAEEPEYNMLYQKTIAELFRERLSGWGIDLSNQELNKLAAEAGVALDFSTIDFSMASDTVARKVCMYYFPWWLTQHLEMARSPVGYIVEKGRTPTFVPNGSGGFTVANGREIVYQKISSMGNGCTFELETALFAALARASCIQCGLDAHLVRVFGDDVVLPTAAAPLFIAACRFSGFVINDDKSYQEGPFRESCGGHYWCGTDVTPFYVRENVSHLDRLFLLHNNTWRWFQRNPGICDPNRVRVLLAWIRGHAPEAWRKPRLMNPDVGDGAFIGKPTMQPPAHFWAQSRDVSTTRRYRGWEGLGVEVLRFESKGDRMIDDQVHDDRKVVFAALWTGLKYELAPTDRPVLPQASKAAAYSEVPWHYRYWSTGVQVYPIWDQRSWF